MHGAGEGAPQRLPSFGNQQSVDAFFAEPKKAEEPPKEEPHGRLPGHDVTTLSKKTEFKEPEVGSEESIIGEGGEDQVKKAESKGGEPATPADAKHSSLSKLSERIQTLKDNSGGELIKNMGNADRRTLEKELGSIKRDLKSILQSSDSSIIKKGSALVTLVTVKFFVGSGIKSQISKAERKENKADLKTKVDQQVKESTEAREHFKLIAPARAQANQEVGELLKEGVDSAKVGGYLKKVAEDTELSTVQKFAKIDVLKEKLSEEKTNANADGSVAIQNLIGECAKAKGDIIADKLSSIAEKAGREGIGEINSLKDEIDSLIKANPEIKTRLEDIKVQCDDTIGMLKIDLGSEPTTQSQAKPPVKGESTKIRPQKGEVFSKQQINELMVRP